MTKGSRLTIFSALADHSILLLDMLDLRQITDPAEVRGNSAYGEEKSDACWVSDTRRRYRLRSRAKLAVPRHNHSSRSFR